MAPSSHSVDNASVFMIPQQNSSVNTKQKAAGPQGLKGPLSHKAKSGIAADKKITQGPNIVKK